MYDGVLGFPVPKEATLISFADYLAVVIVEEHPKDMELSKIKTIHH